MGLVELIESMDIPGLVKKFGPNDTQDRLRGNFQRNFGVACGQNVGPPESVADTIHFSGCTHPRINKDSKDPDILKAFDVAWKVGRMMGIDYCQDGFLKDNSWAKPTFGFVEHMLGQTGFAAMSLCVLELGEGHRVSRHTDDANDPQLSGVLNFNTISIRGHKLFKDSCIFYMRKSVSDFNLRQGACRELVDRCVVFLTACKDTPRENYRLPPSTDMTPEEEVKAYYEDGVGSGGMIVTVDNQSHKIVSAALRSKASSNKQGNFLSSVACAWHALLSCRKIRLTTEFVELVSVVGYLSNIYEYCSVLGMMQEDWDRGKSLAVKGGLVEYVFQRIIELVGSVSGGSGRRCQVFLNKDLKMTDLRNNCHEIRNVMMKLGRGIDHDTPHFTKKQLRNMAGKTILGLSERCSAMGVMTITHLIHSLCLLKLGSHFLLDHALVSPTATQFKPTNLSQTMKAYISKDMKEGVELVNKSDKFAVVMTSVTRALQAHLGNQHLTEATTENILCEASRKLKTFDLYLGCHGFFRNIQPGSNDSDGQRAAEWVAIFPVADKSGMLTYKREALSDAKQLFEHESIEGDGTSAEVSTIWSPSSNLIHEGTVSIGKRRDPKDGEYYPYVEFIISKQELDSHPGLLQSIKVAMARQSSGANKHSECMERLNSLPDLMSIIHGLVETANQKVTRSRAKKRKVSFMDADVGTVTPSPSSGSVLSDISDGSAKSNEIPASSSVVIGNSTWQRGGNREIPELNITYRAYPTERQCEGTVLVNGFLGLTGSASFDRIATIIGYVPPTNTIHSVLSSASKEKEMPRLVCEERRSKRRKKKQTQEHQSNYGFECQENVDGELVFRVRCNYIPDTIMGMDITKKDDGCKVQEMIATSLGGVWISVEKAERKLKLWYFPSKELAMDHFTLWVLCSIGNAKYHKKLLSDVLKKYSGFPSSCKEDSMSQDVAVIGCPMEKVNGKQGVIGYYLLGSLVATEKRGSLPSLVVAIPSRKHSRLRAEGPVNKKTLGKGDKTIFIRLM